MSGRPNAQASVQVQVAAGGGGLRDRLADQSSQLVVGLASDKEERGFTQRENSSLMEQQAEAVQVSVLAHEKAAALKMKQHDSSLAEEEQQQTDLVIKSHELIKRKFFEQLERRESIKNSIKSTMPPVARVSLQQSLRVGCLEADLEALAREAAACEEAPALPPATGEPADKTNSDQLAASQVALESQQAASLEEAQASGEQQKREPERMDDEKGDVSQADLVILPTKYVNERKSNNANSYNNQAPASRQDDRFSRAKRQSRRLKAARAARFLEQGGLRLHSSNCSCCHCCCSSTGSASDLHANCCHLEQPDPLRCGDSLSEELESLVSRSVSDGQPDEEQRMCRANSIELHHRRSQAARNRASNPPGRRQRIDIDCVSPSMAANHNNNANSKSNNCIRIIEHSPRSLPVVHLFSKADSKKSLVPNSMTTTPSTNSSSGVCVSSGKRLAAEEVVYDEPRRLEEARQPASGFWGGFSTKSLIGHSHGSRARHKERSTSLDPNGSAKANKENRKSRNSANANGRNNANPKQQAHHESAAQYESLKPLDAGYSRLHQLEDDDNQSKSLNLYQSLWRSYAKRRHRSCQQPALTRRSLNRCGQLECRSSSSSGCSADPESLAGSSARQNVWGQLTKINKSDGSQVVELRRCPSAPWGFFVARGSIDNARGIFISRWHDERTRQALVGLLSIGDCILAIDELAIDSERPDCDILRVNQLISKKSKILLKVKPFRG